MPLSPRARATRGARCRPCVRRGPRSSQGSLQLWPSASRRAYGRWGSLVAAEPRLAHAHRTFASSRRRVASSPAIARASPSLRIFPPPRAGGSSIASTSTRVGSSPIAAARSGISFFFAFMIPGREGYRGSFSLFCTVSNARPLALQISWPPSTSFQISVPPFAGANFVTTLTWGQPSTSASAGPTKPWSSSDACFPQRTRSGPASSTTPLSARAIPSAPAESTPSPLTRVASSQPIASAWRRASFARGPPTVTTLTTVSGCPSLCSSASSMAYSSYGEIDHVTPSVTTDLPSGATFTRVVESGTCFRQTRIFIGSVRSHRRASIGQPRRDELEDVDRSQLLLDPLRAHPLVEHDQAERATRRDLRGLIAARLACRQDLVDPAVVHALPDLLLHPHSPTPRATAESALAVMRLDLHPGDAGQRVEQRARLVVDAVVPAEVAGIVVGDRLRAGPGVGGRPELQLAGRDELLDELEGVHDLVAPAELRVLVGDRVEAVRARGDHLADTVAAEGLDVLLRLQLPEVLVADPAGRVAVAGLLRAEDRERDAGCSEDPRERLRDTLIAPIERRRAADEVEVLGIGLLGDRRHVQPLRPAPAVGGRLAPRIPGPLDVRERSLRLRRCRGLLHREVAAHVDDLVDVLDRDRALLDAGRARRAGPQLVGLRGELMRRRRARRGGVAQELIPLAQEEVAQVQHDLLRIERLAGRERRAVVGTPAALGAGVTVEVLLPREVAQGRGPEGLAILDALDQPERTARPLRPEEHDRQGRDDVQVLRLREVRGEREHGGDVDPPRAGEDGARRRAPTDRRDERRERRRRLAAGDELGRDARALEDEQRDHEHADEREDDVAVERDVHPWWLEERAPDRGERDRGEHEDREDIDRPDEERALRSRHPPAEDPVEEQVERADRDHDEAPEDERVRGAADVVGTLQQLPLAQVDDELVADPPSEAVGPVLVPAEPQVAIQLPGAVEERAEAEGGDGEEDDRPEALRRRGHGVIPACPRR